MLRWSSEFAHANKCDEKQAEDGGVWEYDVGPVLLSQCKMGEQELPKKMYNDKKERPSFVQTWDDKIDVPLIFKWDK